MGREGFHREHRGEVGGSDEVMAAPVPGALFSRKGVEKGDDTHDRVSAAEACHECRGESGDAALDFETRAAELGHEIRRGPYLLMGGLGALVEVVSHACEVGLARRDPVEGRLLR